MSTQKSTTLYPHPFSKAYWHDAVSELKDIHMLVFAALMIALRLVMKQVSIPITPFLRLQWPRRLRRRAPDGRPEP